MAGVMAGTAILKSLKPTDRLRTITLTINNNCNLACPHCYLQYDRSSFLVEKQTLDSIFRTDFEHLAIVGKEPFVNDASAAMVASLAEQASNSGRTVSVITNGIGLRRLAPLTATYLDYIDISFDGGPQTYSSYRGASFAKVASALVRLQEICDTRLNALHTLSSHTLQHVEDMMSVRNFATFGIIMFSPFLITEHSGRNTVSTVGLRDVCAALAASELFMQAPESLLLLDAYHTAQDDLDAAGARALVCEYGLEQKVKFIETDPLNYGILRVTYDDLVLTPYESTHTKKYNQSKFKASASNLNAAFNDLYTQNAQAV